MSGEATEFNLDEYVMHHIQDSQEWHLPFLPTIRFPEFFSLHSMMLVICATFLILLFCVVYKKDARVPTGITNALEALIIFIRDEIAINAMGEEDGKKYTPLLCTFFFFILGLNLMGMIPLFSTATANVNVTAGLATITLLCMTAGAIYKNGVGGFFKALMPSGVPVPLNLFILVIEFALLFVKAFALTLRLFANMFAGHMVILSMLGIVTALGMFALFPALTLALFISIIEILVAFLQAYVFTFLSAIFIGQMYHPEH